MLVRYWRRFGTGVCIRFSNVIKASIRNFRFATGVIGFNKFSSPTVETVGYRKCNNDRKFEMKFISKNNNGIG